MSHIAVSFRSWNISPRVFSACCPSDFSFKHEAKMQTTFVVAEIWSEPTDERIMDGLRKTLLDSKAGM